VKYNPGHAVSAARICLLPLELTTFEIEAFFTVSEVARHMIEERRTPAELEPS
jgi:hypothetical protein